MNQLDIAERLENLEARIAAIEKQATACQLLPHEHRLSRAAHHIIQQFQKKTGTTLVTNPTRNQ